MVTYRELGASSGGDAEDSEEGGGGELHAFSLDANSLKPVVKVIYELEIFAKE